MTQNDQHYVIVQETHYYRGVQDVHSAAQAISKLPNGWKLISFEFERTEIAIGVWKAVVQGPREKRD